jgi:hypothetical protein
MSERLGIVEAISIRVLGPNMPAGTTGLSVAHGSVTLLNPLTPGTHTIVIIGGLVPTVTTTIVVKPGLSVLQRNPTRDRAPTGDTDAMIFTLTTVAATPSSDVHGACSAISRLSAAHTHRRIGIRRSRKG